MLNTLHLGELLWSLFIQIQVLEYLSNILTLPDEKAKSVVESIVQKGGKAVAIKADVSKSSEVVRFYAETIKQFGGVDIVVNNV